mgnify:FL=1
MIDECYSCDRSFDLDAPHQVQSTPEQVLRGAHLGLATLVVRCTGCERTLEEGAEVEIYAYRAADAPRWTVARWYCRECGPGMIRGPTLGTTEALVAAQLAIVSLPPEQRHSLCVSEPSVTSFSPPTKGSAP